MSRSGVLVILAVAVALAGTAAQELSSPAAAATAGTASSPATPQAAAPSADPASLPSSAPVDTITVDPAVVTVVPGGAGGAGGAELSVTADSTTPLSSMTVHLLDATTGEDTLDPAMSESAGSAATGASTWTSVLITTATLPLGTYNVTVDATDQGGDSVTGTPAGTLAFQDTPSITMHVNPVLSYANQHPVLSGTVTTLAPGGAIPEPYAGQQVVLADSVLGHVTRTTDASGDFSFPFTDPQPGESFTVEVQPTQTVAAADTPSTTFTVYPDQVAMSAKLSAPAVSYGSKVTVSGTVSYAPAGTSVPFPDEPVRVYDQPGARAPVLTAVTDAKGRFAAVLPKEPASVRWVLQAGGPYLGTATVTLPMKVSLPTRISGFQPTLNQFWQVSYRGCLALPAGVPGYVPSLAGLIIQYAKGPEGPWHTLGAVPAQHSVVCGNGGRTFSGTLGTQLNYAYYRAWYGGGTDQAGTGYLSSASGTVLAWKYEDRITSLRVSPRVVAKGGSLTVAGVLQYYSGKWRNYANQQVLVIFRPNGKKTWYWIAQVNTNSSGQFGVTFTDPVTATWSAEYLGNGSHLAAVGAMVFVRVT